MASRKTLSKSQRNKIFIRDNFRCQYCGVILEENNFHIDHMIPLCRGGDNSLENIVSSCPSCNISKGPFTPIEFKSKIKKDLEILEKRNSKVKVLKRFGVIKVIEKDVEFYFERDTK